MGCYGYGKKTVGFHKRRAVSRPAESLSASEGFCSILLLGTYNSLVSTRSFKEAEIGCDEI